MTKTPNFTPTFQIISISGKLTHQQLKKNEYSNEIFNL